MEKAGGGKWKKRPKNGRCGMMPRSFCERARRNPAKTQKKRAPPETHFMRFSVTSVKIHCVNLQAIFAAIACIYWG